MGRLGVLKPLRGTEASLANIVLEDGEIAFSYPSTGPGTGTGGIKMGNGTSTFSALDWYINGEGSGPSPSWHYNEGTDEAALLNNINHPEYETIGKIYYIQAYYHNSSSQYRHSDPVISTGMPYMVIGINHDGTSTTVDLMSLVPANYIVWNSSYNSWSYGKYTTSGLYNWLSDTCPNGYSEEIQSKMINMTERWREATGNTTGEMQSRQTKCKLLNPVEMFGYSSATYDPRWEYASSSDHREDFASPTGDKYGSLYPVWTNNISALSNRRVFHDKSMSTASHCWLNSWLALVSSNSSAGCFIVHTNGSCNDGSVEHAYGVAPVIRLQGTSGPEPSVTGWQGWVNAGGLDYTDYESLDEVLANEKTVRQLMTKHSSVDYLVQHSAASFVSTVINNDYCAKWINLRDYALDTLYADSTIADLMDQADKYFYGELTLMPQVPKMTSNTAPYGEAFADSTYSTNDPFKAFDNDNSTLWIPNIPSKSWSAGEISDVHKIGYKFAENKNITKVFVETIYCKPYSIALSYSNDGTTFTEVDSIIIDSTTEKATAEFPNNIQALYWRIGLRVKINSNDTGIFPNVVSLQFYAWEAKGNVPIMTSNTAPYGEASASSYYDNNPIHLPYTAFKNVVDANWFPLPKENNSWICYKSASHINIKRVYMKVISLGRATPIDITISGSNDGTNYTSLLTTTLSELINPSTTTWKYTDYTFDIDSLDSYLYYKLTFSGVAVTDGNHIVGISNLQFYGRELKVSVPKMTSNTAPYGEASAITVYQSQDAYLAFDNDFSTFWHSQQTSIDAWLTYDFKYPVIITSAFLAAYHYTGQHSRIKTYKYQGLNNLNEWVDLTEVLTNPDTKTSGNYSTPQYNVFTKNIGSYIKYRIFVLTTYESGASIAVTQLNFYGFDYSEYDWDTDNPRHYIYDHGVSVETVTLGGSATKEDNCIKLKAVNDQAYKSLSIADYDLLRGTVGSNASGTNALMCGSSTASFSATNMPYNNSLDVSSISTANNTGVKQTAAGTFDIEEIWLE